MNSMEHKLERYTRDLTELDKLEEYLEENDFNYERRDFENGETISGEPMDWHQIRVYKDDVQIWDVVCHYGSYGSERGLLEGSGEIFRGDVEGWLTAADVIRKVEIGGRTDD